MKRNMIYVLCMLLAAFAFALPFARGSREINLDTLKKPLAPYVTDMEKVVSYGVMSTPALVVNEKVVSMGKVLKAADVEKLLHKLGF